MGGLALAFALSFSLAACAASAPTPAMSPSPVPTQTLRTLTGEATNLSRVAEGRVALVSLWATWCEACTREIDSLNRLAGKTADRKDALVVGVAVGESAATVDAFTKRRAMRYLLLVDEDFALADALGQRHVPATLVIDRAGRVVYRGDVLDEAGLAAFRRALGE